MLGREWFLPLLLADLLALKPSIVFRDTVLEYHVTLTSVNALQILQAGVYILISTSQPAGRLRFIRLSMVLGVGSKTSISRLWTRISNCSRPFL